MTEQHRFNSAAGSDEARPWYGVYLGKIVQTRKQDLWAKLQVPQVMGEVVSNWARPMGFSSIADKTPFPAAAFAALPVAGTDGEGTEFANADPLGWGGYVRIKQQPHGRGIGIAEPNKESGPAPPAGTTVLVLFIGGDRNFPVYALTSQNG